VIMWGGKYEKRSSFIPALLVGVICFFSVCETFGNEWGTHVISVSEKLPLRFIEDYATERYGDAWDFDEGDLDGVCYQGGAKNLVVKEGELQFLTTKDSALVWGKAEFEGCGFGDEKIGTNWKWRWEPWVVRVRLTQSRKESMWFVEGEYSEHGWKKTTKKEKTILGKGRQIIEFRMGPTRGTIFSLRLGTTTPENRVAIDWIKVERPCGSSFFRKMVQVTGSPTDSVFALGTNVHCKVYINGTLVNKSGGRSPFQRRVNVIRVKDVFRKGRNVIAIESQAYGNFCQLGKENKNYLFFQGTIRTVEGDLIRVTSDGSWKGTYRTEKGWESFNYEDGEWSYVTDKGTLEENLLDGFSYKGNGQFREPPYMGRIEVEPHDRELPFFGELEKARFGIRVLRLEGSGCGVVKFTVERQGAGSCIEDGEVRLRRDGVSFDSGIVSVDGLELGPYRLLLKYFVGSQLADERSFEFIVFGPIIQAKTVGDSLESRMTLEPRYEIDVVGDFKKGSYAYGDGSKKKNTMKGILPWMSPRLTKYADETFVETGANKGAWLSFKYRLDNVLRPHLVEIDYPDDRDRNMVVVVGEDSLYRNLNNIGADGGVRRSVAGFYTGGGLETSGHKKGFKFMFWPTRREGTVTAVNCGRSGRDRASVGTIKISEVLGELPALEQSQIPSNVLVGPFVERLDRTTPRVFYAGNLEAKFPYDLVDGYFDGYYGVWYETIANLIRYLRFTGQNTYFAGIYMYYGAWFPSERFQGNAGDGIDYQGAGWAGGAIELMARMFEANNLNLVLGVQFFGSRSLIREDDGNGKNKMAGEHSVRFVSANGKRVYGEGGFNFLMPEVRNEMLGLAEEIADRFSIYPAVKGITWMRLPEFTIARSDCGAQTGLETGYSDYTIGLFQRETGVTVPVAGSDPERFRKRYEWLLGNVQERWLAWRCKKVYDLDSDISRKLRTKRKDWRVWRLATWPTPESIRIWKKGEMTYRDIYRYQGFDPGMYETTTGPRFVPIYDFTGDRIWRDKRGDNEAAELVWSFNRQGGQSNGFQVAGVFVRVGFMIERHIQASQPWPWKRLRVVGNPAPVEPYFSDQAIQLLSGHNLEVVPIGWSDGGHFMGHAQEIRAIVRYIAQQEKTTGRTP